MGKAWSALLRPIRNWNIENRMQKEIEKQAHKPSTAPRYPSIAKNVDDFMQEYPEYLEAQKKKDSDLVERLKHVRVESFGPPPEVKSSRPLPEDRSKIGELEFGIRDPAVIPKGKATIRQALEFISQHQANRQGYTAAQIAEEYRLHTAEVQQVLKYYQTFNLHLPKKFLDKNPKALDRMKAHQFRLPSATHQLPKGSSSKADDAS